VSKHAFWDVEYALNPRSLRARSLRPLVKARAFGMSQHKYGMLLQHKDNKRSVNVL